MKDQPVQDRRYADASPDKLRGGYYTPVDVAAWLARWAIRSRTDRVLEPSCGDGAFLEATVRRFSELRAPRLRVAEQLTAVELIETEALRAQERVSALLGGTEQTSVVHDDFFSWWVRQTPHTFDVALGNPPFIRYQTFPEPYRSLAMGVMERLGLAPNRLTNIWAPFVAASVASLREGGRLAMVLPAELLQVSYAGQIRSFLTEHFSRVDVVACNELFFANAQQEVVLVLADGARRQANPDIECQVALTETASVAEVLGRSPETVIAQAEPKSVQHDSEKWLKYFLSAREIAFMRELRESEVTSPLSSHASVDVGVVTGRNEFFVLARDQVREYGLEAYTSPLVSRSTHLQGAHIAKAEWERLSGAGDRVHLLDLSTVAADELNDRAVEYLRLGVEQQVHQGYKCANRTPWYSVPSVWPPQGFLFRQIYDFPRLVLNDAGATSTDTIHRLTTHGADPERVIANTYTWLTAASAEIEGRSYGGGVLELEPTEAERVLMPSHLNGALPVDECDRLIRAGRLDDVLEENARVILMGTMGLTRGECEILRGIWDKMRNRRTARKKRGRQSVTRSSDA